MSNSVRRLTRSFRHRMLGGICGGLADYLDLDPVSTRVLYVGLTVLFGGLLGVVLYVVGWKAIPLSENLQGEQTVARKAGRSRRKNVGIWLIITGVYALIAGVTPFVSNFVYSLIAVSILLVITGVVLLLWKRNPKSN